MGLTFLQAKGLFKSDAKCFYSLNSFGLITAPAVVLSANGLFFSVHTVQLTVNQLLN